jgi:hypothetical protein
MKPYKFTNPTNPTDPSKFTNPTGPSKFTNPTNPTKRSSSRRLALTVNSSLCDIKNLYTEHYIFERRRKNLQYVYSIGKAELFPIFFYV